MGKIILGKRICGPNKLHTLDGHVLCIRLVLTSPHSKLIPYRNNSVLFDWINNIFLLEMFDFKLQILYKAAIMSKLTKFSWAFIVH